MADILGWKLITELMKRTEVLHFPFVVSEDVIWLLWCFDLDRWLYLSQSVNVTKMIL